MANQLKMAKVHSIQTLHARGWSQRRIARELGIHRETVARYVQRAQHDPRDGPPHADQPGQNQPNLPAGAQAQNRPNPPTGSEDQNRPNPPAGSTGPLSLCEPFREIILAALERGLSSQRIWQDLKTEHGFGGGYDSVKRFCRRLSQATPLPFRRMECEPGAEAQVDFGTAAPVITSEGKRRRPHLFRIVLSHSRKAYSDQACRVAQSHGAYRLHDVRNLIKRQAAPQEQFEFIAEHPLIRSLADYGQLVHNAFEEVHS